MNAAALRTALALLLGLTVAAAPAAAEERAEVTLSAGVNAEPWTGEQTTLYLDLKTPALSFAEVFFDLPAVPGALVLRTDTTTVKLSERRGGETWQVLRYPVTVFPQQSGELTVPPFEVRFKTSAGFGTEPTAHRMRTEAVTLAVRQPPGLAPGTIVVTSSDYTLTANWDLPAEPVRAGDAVTLTVERRAADLSAMLLPALPLVETDGLAAYPAAPEINDRTNRGSLVGERTDRVTWIIEQAGEYALPAVVFRWWDPDRETLGTRRVDGVSFAAAPAPGQVDDSSAAAARAAADPSTGITGAQLAWAAAALLLAAVGLRFRHGISARLAAARRRILPPPRALLRDLNPGSRT